MSKQKFLPESLYGVDSEMNFNKLLVFYENNSSITGKVIRLDSKDQILKVDLGGGIIGIMPLSEATIYPLYEDDRISSHICNLVEKTIRAKIINFSDNQFIVSRKNCMLEAIESIKKENKIDFAEITGFSRMSAFFDIGSGIIGRSYSKAFSNTKFHDIQDVGIQKGDIISVNITNFLEESNTFDLSRVDTLPNPQEVMSKGDLILCKVFEKVGDPEGIGYYVLIDSDYCGILDSPNTTLNYGDKVIGNVKKVTEKGIKLEFVEMF